MWFTVGSLWGLQRDYPPRWEVGLDGSWGQTDGRLQELLALVWSKWFGFCGPEVHLVQWLSRRTTKTHPIGQSGREQKMDGGIARSQSPPRFNVGIRSLFTGLIHEKTQECKAREKKIPFQSCGLETTDAKKWLKLPRTHWELILTSKFKTESRISNPSCRDGIELDLAMSTRFLSRSKIISNYLNPWTYSTI